MDLIGIFNLNMFDDNANAFPIRHYVLSPTEELALFTPVISYGFSQSKEFSQVGQSPQ